MIIIHVSKLVSYITPWNLKMEQVSFRLNLVVLNCFNFFLNLYKSSLLMLAHYYGRLLLRHCFEQLRSTQVAVVHCSAQTTPMHVLQKLQQSCMVISSNTGRVYRPKDCERLVLYLKDLNLPKPDKWGTSQLIAFLQQVLLIDNLVLRQGGGGGSSVLFLICMQTHVKRHLTMIGFDYKQLPLPVRPPSILPCVALSMRMGNIGNEYEWYA